jgi:hypothetical protein
MPAIFILLSLLPAPACARGSDATGDAGDDSGCPSGERLCDGECVSILSDHSNCGECGKECAAAEACYGGSCLVECPAGLSPCGGTCVDTRSDLENCGACGNACSGEAVCSGGECEVHLSGTLSGFKSYGASRVIIDGDVRVTSYNGTDDVTECDADETGCLRIEAK